MKAVESLRRLQTGRIIECDDCGKRTQADWLPARCAWCNPEDFVQCTRVYDDYPDLSKRARKALQLARCDSPEEAREKYTTEQMAKFRYVGEKTLRELGFEHGGRRCPHCGASETAWNRRYTQLGTRDMRPC